MSRKNKEINTFDTVLKYFKKYKRYLVLGGIAVTCSNVFVLIVPYLSKLVFEALENNEPSSVILKYVLLSVGAAILSGLFRFGMRRTIIWMSRYIEYDLRCEVFDHLQSMSPAFYHETRTGDLRKTYDQ